MKKESDISINFFILSRLFFFLPSIYCITEVYDKSALPSPLEYILLANFMGT